MPRLLDRARSLARLRHYSRRTEQAYVFWIKRFIHFHGLRHTAARKMEEAGVGAFTIAAVLGHKNIRTTAIQAHRTDLGARRTVEVLAERVGHNLVTVAGRKA